MVEMKIETNPHNDAGGAWFAYFKEQPSEQDLMDAFRSKYPTGSPDDAAYSPSEHPDAISKAAGLSRWFICQAV